MTARVVTGQKVIRISGKNLGAFALPDVCGRCQWIKMRLQHRLPFGFFPGIFSSIDSYSKRIVHDHFDRNGCPPTWLEPIGDVVDYREPPHWSRFQMLDVTYQILLTGAPDGVFVRRDGSLVIADYKTARHTDAQDALRPMYETQLNAYALIAEFIGMGTVTGLALVYTEPVTDALHGNGAGINDAGFNMRFDSHIVHIDRDEDSISSLLDRVRTLIDRPTPPPSRYGCRDCQQVEALIKLLHPPKQRRKK
jgi:hypothetical protein